jgi:TolB-like protein
MTTKMTSLLKNPMIVFILTFVFLFLQTGPSFAYEREIENLSSILANAINNSGKKNIAVVDFTDLQGNVNELGRFIAEELSGGLINASKNFDVIDRNHLKSLMAEHKLSMSGLIDPNTVKKLGKIAGAEVMVTGSLTPFGDSIRVSCKAIDTTTARVIGVAKADIAKTVTIADLLKLGIQNDDGVEKKKPPKVQESISRIEGQYSAAGRNPNGTTYSGIVTITQRNESYLFVWKIGGSTYNGVGSLSGDTLTVDWGQQYPVIYKVQPTGRLVGLWDNDRASETLTPIQ